MKMETLAITFIVCILVFIVVALFIAIRLMPVITNRLAKVTHEEKRPLKVAKLIALLTLLAILCLFDGCIASCCSGFVTVAKDYTTEETVGITSFQGFPVWYNQDAPGIRIGLIPNRIFANWCAWTTVFILVCCRLYFVRTKSRFVLPVGIILGIGCVGIVAFLLLTATDPSIPVHVEMEPIIKAVNIYTREHNGELPASLIELAKPTKDGKPPLVKRQNLRDPWGKRIEYERKENSFTLRSSGPDKIMGTEDDITHYVADDEQRQGENR